MGGAIIIPDVHAGHPTYEYTTRKVPTTVDVAHSAFDADMNTLGWVRVWADIQSKETYLVYRRKAI